MSRNRNILLCTFLSIILLLIYKSNRTKEFWTTNTKWTKNLDEYIHIDEIMVGPLPQDDPRILDYIEKTKVIYPPSEDEYNLTEPYKDPSMGQATVVRKIFNNKLNGFFVECGALDGEARSNTLHLEKEFNWKGILIEADPSNFKLLLAKHRKAWAANTCLATKPYPHQVLFTQDFNLGRIFLDANAQTNQTNAVSFGKLRPLVKIQCLPLFSLLAGLKVNIVDYFSLDVEGNELQVLENIPFDKILIKVLSIEYYDGIRETIPRRQLNESAIMTEFLKLKGYRLVTRVINPRFLAHDLIFAHNSVDVTGEIEPIETR